MLSFLLNWDSFDDTRAYEALDLYDSLAFTCSRAKIGIEEVRLETSQCKHHEWVYERFVRVER